MSYRNKTYVAFASEDIHLYRMMEAWRDNDHMDFSFFDAHDIFKARDTSSREQIERRLSERLRNAKQVVFIGTSTGRKKGGDGYSFLAHEVERIIYHNLPVVVANVDGDTTIDKSVIPQPFLDANYYTLSVSFRPKIIMKALDEYAPNYASSGKTGPRYYKASVYKELGLD